MQGLALSKLHDITDRTFVKDWRCYQSIKWSSTARKCWQKNDAAGSVGGLHAQPFTIQAPTCPENVHTFRKPSITCECREGQRDTKTLDCKADSEKAFDLCALKHCDFFWQTVKICNPKVSATCYNYIQPLSH